MEFYSTEGESEPFNFLTTKPPEKGKRLFLYQNGQETVFRTFVYNSRNVRDFNSLLNQVTSAMRAPAAVRNIYTPHEGHRVKNLDKLKDGGSYVVGGKEGFKQIGYGMGNRPRNISLRRSIETTSLALPPLPPLPKQIIAQARFLDNTNRPIVITVFRNGELQQKGSKILLTQKELTSWERVLEIVTDKSGLFASAKKIYTTEGKRIKFLTDLEHQGKYVAVEPNRVFRKLPYGAIEMLSGQSPLKISRPIGSHPVLMRKKRLVYRPNVKSEASISNVMTTIPLPPPLNLQPIDIDKRKVRKISVTKQRPLGGRRDKEKREIEKFKFKVREDSAFAPSTATLIQTERIANSPDDHESLVYPNSCHQADDSLNGSLTKQDQLKETVFPLAEGEVEDAPGLVTDKPVDLLPTEEVHEETVVVQRKQTHPLTSSADTNITDTSMPADHVLVHPVESSADLQINEFQADTSNLSNIPIQSSQIDNSTLPEDSIDPEKDATFDKSNTSVTDNIPIITSKNQAPTAPTNGHVAISIHDTITNEQIAQLERHAADAPLLSNGKYSDHQEGGNSSEMDKNGST